MRHPMPYGDLAAQTCQRFATYDDLDTQRCTIEEREEYEPHIDNGFVVYAGVDYERILREAEQEADVILWDGGNNDTPFYRPTCTSSLVDPHRPGHETVATTPAMTNLLMADLVIVNKVDTADPARSRRSRPTAGALNPGARLIRCASRDPGLRPGGDPRQAGAGGRGRPDPHPRRHERRRRLVRGARGRRGRDRRPAALRGRHASPTPSPSTRTPPASCPAMGYGDQQIRDLEATIARHPARRGGRGHADRARRASSSRTSRSSTSPTSSPSSCPA